MPRPTLKVKVEVEAKVSAEDDVGVNIVCAPSEHMTTLLAHQLDLLRSRYR